MPAGGAPHASDLKVDWLVLPKKHLVSKQKYRQEVKWLLHTKTNWELQPGLPMSVRWIEFQSNAESWELRFLYAKEFTELKTITSQRDGWARTKHTSVKAAKDECGSNPLIKEQIQVPKANTFPICDKSWGRRRLLLRIHKRIFEYSTFFSL